jgi:Squalene-hopene cyclase C-terminal domain
VSDPKSNRPLPPPVSNYRPVLPPAAPPPLPPPVAPPPQKNSSGPQLNAATVPAANHPQTNSAISPSRLVPPATTQLRQQSNPVASAGLIQQSVGASSLSEPIGRAIDHNPSASGRKISRKRRGLLATAGARLAERLQQARRMPAWMISFICHLVLLLILALIPIPGMNGSAITLFLGSGDSASISDFELSGGDEAQVDAEDPAVSEISKTPTDLSQMLAKSLPTVSNVANIKTLELSNLMRVEEPNANFGESVSEILSNNGLRGRRGENKLDLLRRGGGSAETEDAVEQGLIWLSKQQRSDGSWSLKDGYKDGGVHENTVAATAMALNAFLGAGYSQLEGKYAGNVQRGLKYLIGLQNEEGFFTTGKEQRDQRAYAQAIATITLLEAFGLSGEYKLREPCMKAIKYAEWAQSKLKGWRYQPREDADLSVTGWFVMALETAKLVGFEVDEDKLQSVHKFLDDVSHREKAAYAYNDLQEPDLTMTAEGLLCRIWLGWPKTHPALLAGVEELVTHIPSEQDRVQSVYYWYYATQVVHHFGGQAWTMWNQEMKRALPAMQESRGDEKGSWSPGRDVYGVAGGRLYTTCLAIYCLEVYYRHLAIYDNL